MKNKKKKKKRRQVKTISRFEKVTHQILYNVYRAHALLAVRIETRPTQSDAVLLIKMCTHGVRRWKSSKLYAVIDYQFARQHVISSGNVTPVLDTSIERKLEGSGGIVELEDNERERERGKREREREKKRERRKCLK